MMLKIRKFVLFGVGQALCCIFPAAIFLLLAFSKMVVIPGIHRYDFILIGCVLVQFLMVRFKLETVDELKVICIFHVIGLCLELFKVHMGSWAYPEPALSKLGDVPLYSGFMYASVASYICQAWRRFNLHFVKWPNDWLTYFLAFIIYLNFFTHHIWVDIRWFIILALFPIFAKSYVVFMVEKKWYRMPMIVSFLLIGFFIWIAENISTFFGAWKYPNQEHQWQMVHFSKISSWFLLVIISIVIVANLKHHKYKGCNANIDKISCSN